MKSRLYNVKDAIKWLFAQDIIRRALHTAWQAGLSVWVISDFSLDTATLAAAAGAALSALKTFVVAWFTRKAA